MEDSLDSLFEQIKYHDFTKKYRNIGMRLNDLILSKRWTELVKRFHPREGYSELESIVFDYLLHLEGLYVYCIDVIIFYLIKTEHHDMWNMKKFNFVKSFNELNDINLDYKLKFLDEHGYKKVSRLINRELRNCIAHNNYSINPESNEIRYNLNKSPGKIIKISEIQQMIKNINILSSYISSKFTNEEN